MGGAGSGCSGVSRLALAALNEVDSIVIGPTPGVTSGHLHGRIWKAESVIRRE